MTMSWLPNVVYHFCTVQAQSFSQPRARANFRALVMYRPCNVSFGCHVSFGCLAACCLTSQKGKAYQ